jgi:Gas vesicle synthesis protein GvpL/GvpF
VYGVVRAGHPVRGDLRGVTDAQVQLVECEDLAVVTTDIPDDVELGESDARAHLDVLVELLGDGPVLPLRLGTVIEDADAVCRDFIGPVAESFRTQLNRFDGVVEIDLNVYDDEEAQLRYVVARDRSLVELSQRARTGSLEERIQFGELVAERLAEARAELTERLLQRLTAVSVEDAPRGGDESAILCWAFLVNQKDLGRFDEVVNQLRTEHQSIATLNTVGPLPPFNFVESPAASNRWGW